MTSFCHALLVKAVTSHPRFRERMNRFLLSMEGVSKNWCPPLIGHSNSIEVWPKFSFSKLCSTWSSHPLVSYFSSWWSKENKACILNFSSRVDAMLATLCMVGPMEGTRMLTAKEFSPHLYLFVPFGPLRSRWNTESGPLWNPHNSSHPRTSK